MLEYLDFEKYKSNGELDRKAEISNIKIKLITIRTVLRFSITG